MKHSIFWKLVLIILPLVLLSDFAVLCATYQLIYDNTMEHYRGDVENAAKMAASLFEGYDPYNLKDTENCNILYDELCKDLDMEYIYAEMPDVENDTFTYLALGFGEKAADEAKTSRKVGYVGKGLYPEEVSALEDSKTVFTTENNEFGHVIICYMPVKRFLMSKYEDLDHTIVIVGAEKLVEDIIVAIKASFLRTAILIFIVTVLIVFIIAFIFRWKVAKPAQLISKRMADFVTDRDKGFEPLAVKGHDEFAEMANSFNSMALEIDRYIDDISQLNSERSTQETELNIARTIQLGLLQPSEFRGRNADLHAFMIPAADVGGDLYDYQVLKNGRICVSVADVSGKGVAAALFMSRAITLLHQLAESGLSPGEIMYQYNNHLAAHNPNTMFITTFVGIYDPKTQELVYSNAGHNAPYLMSDSLITLEGTGSMAAGIFENEEYPENTVKLKAGDTLFLYTDGVTEAKNTENELFGEERLIQTLSKKLGAPGKEIPDEVRSKIRAFSGVAVQSDDITILTLTIPQPESRSLRLSAKEENLTVINDAINSLSLPEQDKRQLRLIAEEMFVNICSYAYEDGVGEAQIDIEVDADRATMTFIDSGKPFDPTKDVEDIDDYDIDNRIGGLGRFLTFTIADSYAYEYRDGKNILHITKNPEEDQ